MNDVEAFDLDGGRYYIYDAPEVGPKLYRAVRTTDIPRVLATHDGVVLYENRVLRVEYEGRLFEAYHDWMGKSSAPTWTPDDVLAEPAVLLERVHGDRLQYL